MKFITLGPEGSNHQFVAKRYIEFHDLQDRATLDLAPDFDRCTQAVLQGNADYLVQCAVHPSTPATVAKFFAGLHVIDTFISPSQDLAILQRCDAQDTGALAVMQPTLPYIDCSRWPRIDFVETVSDVTQGLMEGKYQVGLGYAALAAAHPDQVRIVEFVGTVDDVWIVYGRTRATAGRMAAWPDGPAPALYRKGV